MDGIHENIYEHLLDLSLIDLHIRQLGGKFFGQRDLALEQFVAHKEESRIKERSGFQVWWLFGGRKKNPSNPRVMVLARSMASRISLSTV